MVHIGSLQSKAFQNIGEKNPVCTHAPPKSREVWRVIGVPDDLPYFLCRNRRWSRSRQLLCLNFSRWLLCIVKSSMLHECQTKLPGGDKTCWKVQRRRKAFELFVVGKTISSERLHNLKLVSIQHAWNFVGKISKFMYIIIETNLRHLDELGLRQFWITNELPEQRILITQVISQPFIYPTIKHRDSIQ